MDDPDSAARDPESDTPTEPFLDSVSRRLALVRRQYSDMKQIDIGALFLAFLVECSRFGRFEYGPVSIDVGLVEERFARTYVRLAAGKEPGAYEPSARRFYDLVAIEVAKSGRRRVNELHWLLAFMRAGEGLPAEVFGELGVGPGQIEEFARGERPPRASSEPVRLYSPEEVAVYLGVHVQTVRAWIRSGELPALRLAGRRDLRVRESDLGAVLEPVEVADLRDRQRERGAP